MKHCLLFLFSLLLSVNLSGQIMPGKEPIVRLANESESKLIRSAESWHDIALSTTALSGCCAAVTFIFFVEDMESVLHGQENSDIVVCRYAAAATFATALFSTIAWGVSSNKKHKLPGNCFYLKTSPQGLVIEF